MWSFASSVTTSVISCDASCFFTPWSSISTILRISGFVSGWKTTVASIRFRNSGRKNRFISSLTRSFMCSYAAWVSGSSPVPFARKPSAPSLFSIFCARLLVMMMIVLRKSTVRPFASDSRPSSKICSRMLKTSGWAFSISSSRTTE